MTAPRIEIGAAPLTLSDVRDALAGPVAVTLTAEAEARIERGAATIEQLVAAGDPIYGVNTGFGRLASERIGAEHLERLQVNLVRSHAAGIGELLPLPVVRLVLLLKIASLAAGHSGIRRQTVALLSALLEADILPAIPRQGSVGASGDLAPLAHMSLVLIGEARPLSTGCGCRGRTPWPQGPCRR
jgi:histidine ammonia-lyase